MMLEEINASRLTPFGAVQRSNRVVLVSDDKDGVLEFGVPWSGVSLDGTDRPSLAVQGTLYKYRQ